MDIKVNVVTPKIKHTLFDMEDSIEANFVGRIKTGKTEQELKNFINEWVNIFVQEGTISPDM